MTTIEKIKMDGLGVLDKLKSGSLLSKDEKKMLRIYLDLTGTGKRAGNAGKRKIVRTGK